jgi:hypothetical protein
MAASLVLLLLAAQGYSLPIDDRELSNSDASDSQTPGSSLPLTIFLEATLYDEATVLQQFESKSTIKMPQSTDNLNKKIDCSSLSQLLGVTGESVYIAVDQALELTFSFLECRENANGLKGVLILSGKLVERTIKSRGRLSLPELVKLYIGEFDVVDIKSVQLCEKGSYNAETGECERHRMRRTDVDLYDQ